MTIERNNLNSVKVLDVSYSPDIQKLAEEVARTGLTISLRRGDVEIARLIPPPRKRRASGSKAAELRAALEAAGTAMAGMDPDEVIAGIYKAREEGSRAANRP